MVLRDESVLDSKREIIIRFRDGSALIDLWYMLARTTIRNDVRFRPYIPECAQQISTGRISDFRTEVKVFKTKFLK